MPTRKAYTLIFSHHEGSHFRRIIIPRYLLFVAVVFTAIGLCTAAAGAVHYWKLSVKLVDYTTLARENQDMRFENQSYRTMARHVQEKVSVLEMISKKLTVTAGLESAKNLEDTLEHAAKPSPGFPPALSLAPNPEFRQLDEKMLTIEATLRKVNEAYNEQSLLTAYTPSIWPVLGPASRGFGSQVDPLTGEDGRHSGIDIRAPYGQRVQASAAGIVLFSGYRKDYGNLVIIDHRFGLSTWYGHLMRTAVRTGQRVRRHDVIGHVGSTGRSTGPHLHYEVRMNDAPVNPHKFLSSRPAKKHTIIGRKPEAAD
ncbi:MAG: M23 family metallopeptidase [Acidobacteria bacterium]|nr:M23 family metallopeptidase [Acidobacteriota bacterium]MBI3657523.1 M23 family metallopeptidase [Acidobacteriota bacterium]